MTPHKEQRHYHLQPGPVDTIRPQQPSAQQQAPPLPQPPQPAPTLQPTQPKKRGPKVGSRRARLADTAIKLGQPSSGSVSKPHHHRLPIGGGPPNGWQHETLPVEVASSVTADMRAVGANERTNENQQLDPYAFHCDSTGYLDNASMNCRPTGELNEYRQSKRKFQESRIASLDDRHCFSDHHQLDEEHLIHEGTNQLAAPTIQSEATIRNTNISNRTNRDLPRPQDLNQVQQSPSGRMIAHHPHQQQAQHHQTSRVQMQPIKQQPMQRNPTASNSIHHQHLQPPVSNQQHGGQHQIHLNQYQQQQQHPHQQTPAQHQQSQVDLETALPIDSQQHNHNHVSHHHQHQFNASNTYYNNEPQCHPQQLEVQQTHQQLPSGHQMFERQQPQPQQHVVSQPISSAHTHQASRYAAGINNGNSHYHSPQPQNFPNNSNNSMPPSLAKPNSAQQAYNVAGPQQHQPQHLTSFHSSVGQAPEMNPSNHQSASHLPRANLASADHLQSHHQPQQQQRRVLGPAQSMLQQQQQQYEPTSGNLQHIPVRSNAVVQSDANLSHYPQQNQQLHIDRTMPNGQELHGPPRGGNSNMRRTVGPPQAVHQPIHIQNHQTMATSMKHSPRSSSSSSAFQHAGGNEVYQAQRVGPPPALPMQAGPKQPARAQQAIRQQVINHHMDNGNAHMNQQQQQQHLLCNPTPPLTPNAIPPMAPVPQQQQQQQQLSGRVQMYQDEWSPQSHAFQHNHHPHHQHHHRQQQHNFEPISEQPHLPIHPVRPINSGAPDQIIAQPQPALKQHQLMRPAHHVETMSAPNLISETMPMQSSGLVSEPKCVPPQTGLNQYHHHPVQTVSGSRPAVVQASSHHQPAAEVHHNIAKTNNNHNPSHYQQLNSHATGNPSHLGPKRLTLPLRDASSSLLGPLKLEHGVQYIRKSFCVRPQLLEQLARYSSSQHQGAAVIQELQFRAYLTEEVAKTLSSGDSLLAPQSPPHSIISQGKACQWPEFFQVSINQQPVLLDRGIKGQAHRAVDVFKYCREGENLIEFQVNDCYCLHEFVIELVDRPTLKAFMDSCFKSRLLPQDSCLSRLKMNFGTVGFIPSKLTPEASQLLQAADIHNDYVNEFSQQQQVTKAKISLRCPLTARRMRAPARGPNCKHLQCFDLENFLQANCSLILWSCPVCSLPVPFNMLEIDQFQMGILQAMQQHLDTDEILVDAMGQWKAFYHDNSGLLHQDSQHYVTKSNSTFHSQISNKPSIVPSTSSPMRPTSRPIQVINQAGWSQQDSHAEMTQQHQHRVSPVRRPPSAISGGQSTPPMSVSGRPMAKRAAYSNGMAQQQPQRPVATGNQSPHQLPMNQIPTGPGEELSPLAAMERAIIQQEQQMCPPPFDSANLIAGPGSVKSSVISGSQQQPPQPPTAIQATNAPVASSPGRPVGANGSQPGGALPGSPHSVVAQSVCQSPQLITANTNLSMPATPIIHHAGPETPATPGSSSSSMHQHQHQQPPQQQPAQASNLPQSSFAALVTGGCSQSGVDHQPLSNGSVSAGSITSSSTVMTPSGQSLGSVGMGGDSRCNTAPLQPGPGGCSESDLASVMTSYSQGAPSNRSHLSRGNGHGHLEGGCLNQEQDLMNSFDDKNSDILMSKLMMDSESESMSHHRGDKLTLAFEEAQWKQQLDRGKSEHLANFLNDPLMMNGQASRKHQSHHQMASQASGANKMLSGGLNPSDDESDENSPHGSSASADLDETAAAGQHNHHQTSSSSLDQPLDPFVANYLNSVDDGAGLPPDDSILDLFER